MVFLLAAQLIWWIIFYELSYQHTNRVQLKLDRMEMVIANGGVPTIAEAPALKKEGGRYIINEEVVRARSGEHRRKLFMLVSETIFVLTVIVYGSVRLLRSVRNERIWMRDRTIFLNSITHELKTPLATILLNNQTLLKRKLNEKDRTELIHSNIENIRRLEEQVNEIVLSGELVRLRSGNRSGELESRIGGVSSNATEVIDQYLEEISGYLQREHATISLERNLSHEVAMPQELFKRVVSNLITNAIQYSEQDPVIEITLEDSESMMGQPIASLSIADNGVGIDAREREKIFQPFYRIGNDRRAIRGSGIGLFLVKEIVDTFHGEVHVESRREGGSLFKIRLPGVRRV